MKYWKCLIILLVIFAFSTVSASSTGKLKTVGTQIADTNAVELELNTEGYETNLTEAGTYENLHVGEPKWIYYPNAIEYFGKRLAVKVTLELVEETDSTRETVAKVASETEYPNRMKAHWSNVTAESATTRLKWKIEVFDQNHNPYKTNLLVGFYDPDESHYLFDTKNHDLYYVLPSSPTESEKYDQFADGLDVRSSGVYVVDKQGNLGQADWNNGILITNMNYQTSFTMTTLTPHLVGFLVYPYFYQITEEFDITYVLNGGTNNPSNPTKYTPGTKITILDPTREGYTFVGWEEGNTIGEEDVGNKTFTAIWKKVEFTITTEVVGGTIDSPQTVEKGGDVIIHYKGDNDTSLKQLLVDGEEVDIEEYYESFPFSDVQENHTIKAIFITNPKTGSSVNYIFFGGALILAFAGIFIIRRKNAFQKI
jgi:uncharacterized repeat protein (TIGR02543 family)/LPXTG-motif cell wall-anchored protein